MLKDRWEKPRRVEGEKQENHRPERLGQVLQFVPSAIEVLSDTASLTRPPSTELAVGGRPFRIDSTIVLIGKGF